MTVEESVNIATLPPNRGELGQMFSLGPHT